MFSFVKKKIIPDEKDDIRSILKTKYPELYVLTDKEKSKMLNTLLNIDWKNIGDTECSIGRDWGCLILETGKKFLLFSDVNRTDYDIIDIVRYKYYTNGTMIAGLRNPTTDYKYSLRITVDNYMEYVQFNKMEDLYNFIWGVKKVQVGCPECYSIFNEDDVRSDGIEYDEFGRDLLIFECPKCKKTVKSLRFGVLK